MPEAQKTRHILGLSGGKDSSALAVYLRDRVPDMEYVFTDTLKELPETYEYLAKLEAYLGKPIVRLNAERGFDHWLKVYNGYLPNARQRWCTRMLKIRPFEQYIGDDDVISYVGIRADEDREGYVSTKPNIRPVFPFKEDGITRDDVFRILDEAGLGLPKYYEWRSRSGCYFCFFQRKAEWAGLLERHPDLFKKAMEYEQPLAEGLPAFTWDSAESLEHLSTPTRLAEIRRKAGQVVAAQCETSQLSAAEMSRFMAWLSDSEDPEDQGCFVCHK
ncbi:MAG: phosphoadenosine phosphosulfate reductase family protein [Planctomycetes bacterium]|nr:phosphoadenosine phosphosulfate reductase family protein [Planctomycetota bacterium]